MLPHTKIKVYCICDQALYLVITITASVEEDLLLLVLLRIQNVITEKSNRRNNKAIKSRTTRNKIRKKVGALSEIDAFIIPGEKSTMYGSIEEAKH